MNGSVLVVAILVVVVNGASALAIVDDISCGSTSKWKVVQGCLFFKWNLWYMLLCHQDMFYAPIACKGGTSRIFRVPNMVAHVAGVFKNTVLLLENAGKVPFSHEVLAYCLKSAAVGYDILFFHECVLCYDPGGVRSYTYLDSIPYIDGTTLVTAKVGCVIYQAIYQSYLSQAENECKHKMKALSVCVEPIDSAKTIYPVRRDSLERHHSTAWQDVITYHSIQHFGSQQYYRVCYTLFNKGSIVERGVVQGVLILSSAIHTQKFNGFFLLLHLATAVAREDAVHEVVVQSKVEPMVSDIKVWQPPWESYHGHISAGIAILHHEIYVATIARPVTREFMQEVESGLNILTWADTSTLWDGNWLTHQVLLVIPIPTPSLQIDNSIVLLKAFDPLTMALFRLQMVTLKGCILFYAYIQHGSLATLFHEPMLMCSRAITSHILDKAPIECDDSKLNSNVGVRLGELTIQVIIDPATMLAEIYTMLGYTGSGLHLVDYETCVVISRFHVYEVDTGRGHDTNWVRHVIWYFDPGVDLPSSTIRHLIAYSWWNVDSVLSCSSMLGTFSTRVSDLNDPSSVGPVTGMSNFVTKPRRWSRSMELQWNILLYVKMITSWSLYIFLWLIPWVTVSYPWLMLSLRTRMSKRGGHCHVPTMT